MFGNKKIARESPYSSATNFMILSSVKNTPAKTTIIQNTRLLTERLRLAGDNLFAFNM